MPIKHLAKPLPPECRQLWTECRELLILAEQCAAAGESAGRDMSSCRELGELLRRRWEAIGWTYYPEEMPAQVVE